MRAVHVLVTRIKSFNQQIVFDCLIIPFWMSWFKWQTYSIWNSKCTVLWQKHCEWTVIHKMLKHCTQNIQTSCQNIMLKYRDFVLKHHAQI